MLVDFTVRNWKSYAGQASLNLVASRERHHAESLSAVPGFRSLKVNPIAAIYGGNASGKSNLFDALAFVKQFVLHGAGVSEPIAVEPYRLNADCLTEPSSFDISFLADGSVYRLHFSATHTQVLEESLEILREKRKLDVLYERDASGISVLKAGATSPERLRFIAEGTRRNCLFLTAAAMQNVRELEAPYGWFKDCLELVGVSSYMPSLAAFYTREDFLPFASRTLVALDTGIEDLVGEPVDPASLDISLPSVNEIALELAGPRGDGGAAVLFLGRQGDYASEMLFLTVDKGAGGQVSTQRLRARHRDASGKLVTFPLQMESSGSRRLIHLMPMLLHLLGGVRSSQKVYVVDELDRSLHSMLTLQVVREYLSTCGPASRRQLLFTTHDLLLMDQRLMRRDEMYITEREGRGESVLIGLSEYGDLRSDKDLLRSYLDGRFGGVPMFRSVAASSWAGEER